MTNAVMALPTSGDQSTWNAQESALVEAAGLVRVVNRNTGEKALADRPTVEAFLQHCRRTGLDPIARQIYAIYRGGKWGIQISIDGARLVAERTRQYEGQTPVEWTADGVTWTQVWLSEEHPAAARVGVYRTGFREALYAVATWDSYVVMKDVWHGGRKVEGEQVVSDMWQKFGPLMLGKCAEMLALRKAFPQDLSGLYSTEEMQQADKSSPVEQAPVQQPAVESVPEAPAQPSVASQNWAAQIVDVATVHDLRAVYDAAVEAGEVGLPFNPQYQTHLDGLVDLYALEKPSPTVTVQQMIGAVKKAMEEAQPTEGELMNDGGAEGLHDAQEALQTEFDAEPGASWETVKPGEGVAFR